MHEIALPAERDLFFFFRRIRICPERHRKVKEQKADHDQVDTRIGHPAQEKLHHCPPLLTARFANRYEAEARSGQIPSNSQDSYEIHLGPAQSKVLAINLDTKQS